MLQYVLRDPEAGGELDTTPTHGKKAEAHSIVDIWELTGNVVRNAFDLGLHLETEGTNRHVYTPLQLDLRRRLFWA